MDLGMKFKIFIGTAHDTADYKANIWMKEHPNVVIHQMEYRMNLHCEHSICIMYKEYKGV